MLARCSCRSVCSSPDIDESHRPGESAIELVSRPRRRESTRTGRQPYRSSDYRLRPGRGAGERIIGKPHTFEKAREQLLAASGASVTFLTGLALLNSQTGHCQVDCVPFTVHMRTLDSERIERYLRAEQPYDCAGSFKAEGLGVSLFQSTEGPDATSLIGLPLIRLVDMLAGRRRAKSQEQDRSLRQLLQV